MISCKWWFMLDKMLLHPVSSIQSHSSLSLFQSLPYSLSLCFCLFKQPRISSFGLINILIKIKKQVTTSWMKSESKSLWWKWNTSRIILAAQWKKKLSMQLAWWVESCTYTHTLYVGWPFMKPALFMHVLHLLFQSFVQVKYNSVILRYSSKWCITAIYFEIVCMGHVYDCTSIAYILDDVVALISCGVLVITVSSLMSYPHSVMFWVSSKCRPNICEICEFYLFDEILRWISCQGSVYHFACIMFMF